jgi:trimeric autotransporter adhesin
MRILSRMLSIGLIFGIFLFNMHNPNITRIARADTNFIVNNDADAHDANLADCTCADGGGDCTLRAAIEEANACTGTDTITFSNAMTIKIDPNEGALPGINETVIIDASSRWNSLDDTPGITIDGQDGSFSGLIINANSCQIFGLTITNFKGSSIYIKSANNLIGYGEAGKRNVISGNGTGITLDSSSAQNNIIINNYIGLTPTGDNKDPNDTGIVITLGANNNIIGGSEANQANFIGGNDTNGILIEGASSTNNWIRGNAIGYDGQYALEGNGGHGIRIQSGAPNTVIGGGSQYGNFIGGSVLDGIYINEGGMLIIK